MAMSAEQIRLLDAYWRAANYLTVGQIYLRDNPLLREPLTSEHVKPRLLGHWGTSPGLSFIYAHLNRLVTETDADVIYLAGPGHGGPAIVANVYLEGTYSEIYPDVSKDAAGQRRLFRHDKHRRLLRDTNALPWCRLDDAPRSRSEDGATKVARPRCTDDRRHIRGDLPQEPRINVIGVRLGEDDRRRREQRRRHDVRIVGKRKPRCLERARGRQPRITEDRGVRRLDLEPAVPQDRDSHEPSRRRRAPLHSETRMESR